MVKIIGNSKTVIDIAPERARALIRAGVAQYVNDAEQAKAETHVDDQVPATPQAQVEADSANTEDAATGTTGENDELEGLPAKNASRDDWAEAALAAGISEDDLQGLKRDEIIQAVLEHRNA